ncbi:MAG: iron-containing alcohol dehydrogenase, partial [Bacteroides sp.]
LIALPTTAGTGSEATHFAVIYKNKIKYSVAHKDILPNIAVVAAEFTYNNTKYLTACTGFDALSQAIEAYWNVNATKESDEYAIKAIKLLWQNLPLVVNTPNKHIRDQVSIGAYWAGRAINITMTTAPHAFSYPFTTYYHYPHGHAVALTFPFWCKYNFENSSIATNTDWQLKKEILKKLFDIKEDSAALEFFYSYINSIGLFYNLPIDFDYNTIIENINFPRLKNNPIPISHITSITIMKSFVAYSKN